MSKPSRTEIVTDNPLDHQAVRAWAALKPARVKPDGIEILKLKNKSAVYRLVGVSQGGSSVVAKRCRTATASVERMMHEEFLPRLPLPALRWYGFVEEPDDDYGWLFLEDAGAGAYLPSCAEHRALAGRWLGVMHAAAMKLGLKLALPDRSPVHYLKRLQASREEIRLHFDNSALREEDIRMLKALTGDLDVLEAHWGNLKKMCQGVSRTVVHGDFVMKNVRVETTIAATRLLVFDWEHAGWGIPCTDLAQLKDRTVSPDLDTYASALREFSPDISDFRVRELAECGKFFRLLDEIGWESPLLNFGPYRLVVKPASRLRLYQSQLHRALLAVGWAGSVGRPEAAGSRSSFCGQARHRNRCARTSQILSRATVKLARWRPRFGYDV